MHVVALFNVVVPDTFKDDNNVELPETTNLLKFVLFNNVVDVAFKLLIDNIEFVDKLFKLFTDNVELLDKPLTYPNNVVDVAFKLFTDNVELVDKLIKSVVNANIDILLLDDKIEVVVFCTELS
jgi:hypothetical protein